MRPSKSCIVSALCILAVSTVVEAFHNASSRQLGKRHMHSHHKRSSLTKRSTCAFPSDDGLVAVNPGGINAGWALSPDVACGTSTQWCTYACPPGQLAAQWDPSATSYSYPESMNGGLYCDNGELSKPFPDKPYCYDGHGTFVAHNNCDQDVAICQTVLPGREDMLIPTVVGGSPETLAIPGPEYWVSTAAHYYINPPGVSASDGCVWGSNQNPVGNWAPYVSGGNVDNTGDTYVKIGWNPIYLERATPFRNELPTFGVRIECDDDAGCNGLPCGIDPSVNGVNEVSGSSSIGAGSAAFCVVTAPVGVKARLVVFQAGGGSGDSSSSSSSSSSSESSPIASSSSSTEVSSTSTSSSSSSTSTTSSSTSSTSTSTPTTSSTSTSSTPDSSTSTSTTSSTSSSTTTTSSSLSSSSSTSTTESLSSSSSSSIITTTTSSSSSTITSFSSIKPSTSSSVSLTVTRHFLNLVDNGTDSSESTMVTPFAMASATAAHTSSKSGASTTKSDSTIALIIGIILASLALLS